MNARLRTGAWLAGLALLVLAGSDAATYATTGDSLIAGRKNSADRPTTVVNEGSRPALRLRSSADVPSLRVSSPARVPRLNADTVDGQSSERLNPPWQVYGYNGGGEQPQLEWSFTLPDVSQSQAFFQADILVVAEGETTAPDVSCVLSGGTPVPAATIHGWDSPYLLNELQHPAWVTGAGMLVAIGGPTTLECVSADDQAWVPDLAIVGLEPLNLRQDSAGPLIPTDAISSPPRLRADALRKLLR